MPEWSALLPFIGLAAVGAGHCAGMCGGFAVGITSCCPAGGRALAGRQLCFVLGKAVTYGVLGILAATFGELVAHAGDAATSTRAHAAVSGSLRGALAVLAGGAMMYLGLTQLVRFSWRGKLRAPAPRSGGPPGRAPRGRFGSLVATVGRTLRAMARLPGYAGALATGLVTGLLPCGLSWSAFALAATLDPVTAGIGTFLFGMTTAPSLLVVGLGWRGLTLRRRAWARWLAGPVLIGFGALTALRGFPDAANGPPASVLPDCCAEPAPVD